MELSPYIDLLDKISIREFASMIDHTFLKPQASFKELEKYVNDARQCGFACIVVPPSLVEKAQEIAGGTVRIASVVGFPLGNTTTKIKVLEARELAVSGVSEIDMVMNVNFLKSGFLNYVAKDIEDVVKESKKLGVSIVKVIIETGLLTDEEKSIATELVVKAGADYVKTSTGFLGTGATVHDVALLYKASRGRVKVKASGGIRHALDALALIAAGASRIGTSAGDVIYEEFVKLKESSSLRPSTY